jgi:hypothetical protein
MTNPFHDDGELPDEIASQFVNVARAGQQKNKPKEHTDEFFSELVIAAYRILAAVAVGVFMTGVFHVINQ